MFFSKKLECLGCIVGGEREREREKSENHRDKRMILNYHSRQMQLPGLQYHTNLEKSDLINFSFFFFSIDLRRVYFQVLSLLLTYLFSPSPLSPPQLLDLRMQVPAFSHSLPSPLRSSCSSLGKKKPPRGGRTYLSLGKTGSIRGGGFFFSQCF